MGILAPNFYKAASGGSKRSYHNLFEGDPSNIEQERPICSPRLQSVSTRFLDSSTELRTVFSAVNFYKAALGGSNRTYHNLFEGDPSTIERERPICSLQLHSVSTRFLDSSTELWTVFSAPDFYKVSSGGFKRTYHNLFEGNPSIIARERPSCSLRLQSVSNRFLDSSTELWTVFSASNFHKVSSGGSIGAYFIYRGAEGYRHFI